MTETTGLYAALARLARVERILVASDFDGVLAPLVQDPSASRAVEGAIEVLERLAELPGVTVVLVSGRDLATLDGLAGLSEGSAVGLVGSHGAASSFGPPHFLDAEATSLLRLLDGEVAAVANDHGGRVERKPTSVVLHTRGLDRDTADRALAAAHEVGGRHTGVVVTPGKEVVELSVVQTSKGAALRDLAAARDATATAYFGDDVTDETAFEALTGPDDVTVKVGDGASAARYRVPDEAAVVAALGHLLSYRSRQTW